MTVYGGAVSPRGSDRPDGIRPTHSPTAFIRELGEAYRASGRTKPIADDLSVHCYPNVNTDAPSVGYVWPKVGCINLDRFKQAWWDVFHGTGQPVFREAGDGPGRYVRTFIDEERAVLARITTCANGDGALTTTTIEQTRIAR